ncbi:DNA repair protein RecN [bacterium HR29]|nr:DNA repair protein RecN [bacterium HR29]
MFEELVIENFAVARSVRLPLGPGLTVFTGETGAGKSLIVDAIAFLLGARRGREAIAAGASQATVRARLRIGGAVHTLERSISLSGRSRAALDGEPIQLEALQELAGELADIHGQAEQLALLRPSVQLALLDAYGGLEAQRDETARLVRELRAVRRRLEALRSDARERERQLDQLRYEVAEIERAELRPGEDTALRDELSRLASIERLREAAAALAEALDSPAFDAAFAAARAIVERDPGAGEVRDLAVVFEETAAELRRAVRRYAEGLEADPERLVALQERLDLIARLRRKYGETIEEVLAYLEAARERLAVLEGAEESAEELQQREAELSRRLAAAAEQLSAARREAAARLTAAVAAELAELAMPHAALAVGFACSDAPDGVPVRLPDYEVVGPSSSPLPLADAEAAPRAFTESGVDRVEFLASFNPGESPRALSAVASGGETSRFLIALTAVFGSASPPRTIVLDEADEGVGGRAGALVGKALRRLAQRHQVLCVTHLPQVAAFGDRHFVVVKHTDGRRTWSEVRDVTGPERLRELAAMLGGPTEANLRAAEELLAAAAAQ